MDKLPSELLYQILSNTADIREREGVGFTFGLTQIPPNTPPEHPNLITQSSPSTGPVQRYLRGPVPPYQRKWDATSNIRSVCRSWHDWSIEYALKDVYVKLWRGSERWCDLSLQRDKYPLYELIEKPRGERVYRDPHSTLQQTRKFFESNPDAASSVRRLWFNGLYTPKTDIDIIGIIHSCVNVTSVSLPWTILRHGIHLDWATLLATNRRVPLQSLELLAVSINNQQANEVCMAPVQWPLLSPIVDFSRLKRLKLFGNTEFMPVNDDDLKAIARTATHLEEFQLTCISTVSIEGVMAIVRASQKTLRVLEHSPRSDDGFWHPHPGYLSDGSHICSILTACPKLQDLSISLPSMCQELFSNTSVRWKGDFQVRATDICGHDNNRRSNSAHEDLLKLLRQARRLCAVRARSSIPAELRIEIFFADMIFDPHIKCVHGDFSEAEFASGGTWPSVKAISRKGPYGSTGLYGKDEEFLFECINESDFFAGLARNLVQI